MKIICAEKPGANGKRHIYDIVKDSDWLWYEMPTGSGKRVVIDVAETEDNKTLRIDMLRKKDLRDADGEAKYTVDAQDKVNEKPNWKPHAEALSAAEIEALGIPHERGMGK